jgi:chromosome partitioning protein
MTKKIKPKMTIADAAAFMNVTPQAIYKRLREEGYEPTKSGNRVYLNHETARKLFNLPFQPTCIVFHNLKGGVGKTHFSFNIAVRLSLYGAKVALIDLDQQGNLTQACNIDAENKKVILDVIVERLNMQEQMQNVCPGIDILPSKIDNAVLDSYLTIENIPLDRVLSKYVEELKANYDYVIIDTPPSLSSLVTSACLAADYVIIPTDPEKFSLNGLTLSLKELKKISQKFELKTPIEAKVVLNKFDVRTKNSNQMFQTLLSDQELNPHLLGNFVRVSQEFPNSVTKNQSIYDSPKSSSAKEDIDCIAKDIIELSSPVSLDEERVA